MYLLYVDESGDTGHLSAGSQTEFFVLSGIVIHELEWKNTLDQIVNFRRVLKQKYKLKISHEIHCRDFFGKPGPTAHIPKYQRLQILKEVVTFQSQLMNYSIINIVVDKRNLNPNFDIFENAWTALLQRFHNTIKHKNFPGPQNAMDFGLVVSDATEGEKLTKLIRKLRRFNFVPSQYGTASIKIPLDRIVEDPISRDSKHSLIVQLCDVNAYTLFQNMRPNKYYRKKGEKNWFQILKPVLNIKASAKNKWGIVVLE